MSISIQRRRWIWISLVGLWLGSVPSITEALDANDILRAHNTYRATHQAGALAWSASLAQEAQNYADTCPTYYDTATASIKLVHSGTPGENLSGSGGSESEADIVARWYDRGNVNEKQVYERLSSNYTVNYPMTIQEFNNDHKSGNSYGHFTQVIWRSTTQLGCAQATCDTGGWRYVTVCRYAPAGNYVGQFLQNVKAPSNSGAINPRIAFQGIERYSTNSDRWVRFKIPVTNWSTIPDSLFEAAPDLPPCGLNNNSSRTWVDIKDAGASQSLYGFCALGRSSDLANIWFAVEEAKYDQGQYPSSVYIVLNDRRANRLYRSNTVGLGR